MAYVYRHIRLDTMAPYYIGVGRDDVGKYVRSESKSGRSRFWHNITNKHGNRIDILLDDLSWDEAIEKEIEFINIYGRMDKGGILCNLTDGGEGTAGILYSEETRQKMSAAKKGKGCPQHLIDANVGRKLTAEHKLKIGMRHTGTTKSPECKAKISAVHKGKKKSPEAVAKSRAAARITYELYGKPPISEETREKKRISATGKKHSDEAKRKISLAQVGRVCTPETRKKLSAAGTGRLHTPESIEKMRVVQSNRPSRDDSAIYHKRIAAMTEEEYRKFFRMRRLSCHCAKTGEWLADYDSQQDAIKALGISSGGISDILNGKIKNPKKYIFKFLE